jgi:ABC-type polysaccharide transport system permease subunit
MDWDSILNTAIPLLISAVVIPLIVAAGNAVKKYFNTKTTNERLQHYFDMAADSITTAVAETMQTFVTTMKNEGKWDAATAQKAFEMAKNRAIELMGVAAYKVLPEIVDDVEKWLTSKIEAATLNAKWMTAA